MDFPRQLILINNPNRESIAFQNWVQDNYPDVAQMMNQQIVLYLRDACEICDVDFTYLFECWEIERERQIQERYQHLQEMLNQIQLGGFNDFQDLGNILQASNIDAYAVKPPLDEDSVNKFIKKNISQEKVLEDCSSCLLTYEERKALVNEGNTEDFLKMFLPPDCTHPMCTVCAKELIMLERTSDQVINCPICRTEINVQQQNVSCSASASASVSDSSLTSASASASSYKE